MKKVVTQMIGCLNVLSRLKNPGIRINSAGFDESIAGSSAPGPLYAEPRAAATSESPRKGEVPALRYYDDFTASFSMLVNFEQFG